MVTNSEIELREVGNMTPERLAAYLERYRPRLKRMVAYRIHRQLQGRVDGSDVVQEAMADAVRKLRDLPSPPSISLLNWLRRLTWLKLAELHRKHLGTLRRDAHLDVSFHEGLVPGVDSGLVAAGMAGGELSSSQVAIAKETRQIIEISLRALEPLDRELLVMKHYEALSISEIAEVLGMPRSTAGRKYLAAVDRFRRILERHGDLRPD
jgi:RNA polymerase sigma-70 factor, ECF subfamily